MRKLYLHILQLEGYEASRFLRWISKNLLTRTVEGKKPLVWTSKSSTIYYLSIFLTILLPLSLYLLQPIYVLPVLFVLVFVPWTSLLLALACLKPYEIYNRQVVINKTREKIQRLNSLQVIGITGSYGKTSVKEILYQILRQKYRVLRTPSSYNTVFGIAKVVDLELDRNYDFFICEMGAYKKGDIAELCRMVLPKHGILTGIAEQHLERFGSLQNIIQGKFELIESLPTTGHALLNGDNPHVVENVWRAKSVYKLYGVDSEKAEFKAENIKYSKEGTEFTVRMGKDSFNVKTKLLGKGSIQNILGAAGLARELGLSVDELREAINNLETTPNRLELIYRDDLTILNDSYSSNPAGFKEAVSVVRQMGIKRRVLITPGIVELGSRTKEVHEELGIDLDGVFEVALLVGDSERTRALAKPLKKTRSEFVKSTKEALERVKSFKDAVVLIENDLPDNY